MPHLRFTITNRRFTMFADPAGENLPLPAAVHAALFQHGSSAGFVAVPGMQATAPQPSALPLYQWAQETARAQVCERRAQRLTPHAN
ncbi:MAG: hypothetical protein SH850_09085 [Planctomycetaceae bacterium]|nr:hypothetical protein [Planctomycetaceae bacterium]